MTTRRITTADLPEFLQLIDAVERDSEYMLMEPGERDFQSEEEKISKILNLPNCVIIAAEMDHKLAGYIMGLGGQAVRNRHSVYLVAGVLKEYRGRGIGTQLFDSVESWAVSKNIHRLELTTAVKNTSAVHLYKKAGFEIEGIKKDSLKINQSFIDEYYMCKIIQS
ncbi:GNAT family N-acetyltransferase [Halobacillus massiliensis]|uniref:GNAT family N-acetyltransferase n=1 Tax=Halobacillus massiliensis TaxID=1926286 RepID=UPI0009E422CC|nr:GNAT family N-acetyltransferase [Halobacillus massiliensis]